MTTPLPHARPDTPAAQRSGVPGWLIAVVAALVIAVGSVSWVYDGWVNRFDVTVAVENGTGATVRRVEFYFGGRTVAFDNIAPGATVRRQVTLRGSGAMTYTVLPQPGPFAPGTAWEYLDADCKGQRIGLRLRGDGTAEDFLP